MTAAAEVYEILLLDVGAPRSWWQKWSRRPDSAGVIISVIHTDTGSEIFRHIEDVEDDEDHLLDGIRQDLASMTAADFAGRWGS